MTLEIKGIKCILIIRRGGSKKMTTSKCITMDTLNLVPVRATLRCLLKKY